MGGSFQFLSYIQVVLQGLWGGPTGPEAHVVLLGESVGPELIDLFPRVTQLTSDGPELLQGDSGKTETQRLATAKTPSVPDQVSED